MSHDRFDKSDSGAASRHPHGARALGLALVCCALGAAAPALGEVYKWADEDGVVHYSSAPPEKSKAKVKRIDSRELAVSQASSPEREAIQRPEARTVQDLAGKVDDLQRKVDAEHQARQAADAQNLATQAAYAQALADQQAAARNIGYIPAIPTASGVLFVPSSPRFRNHPCRTAGGITDCVPRDAGHDRHGIDHDKPPGGMRR